MRRAASVLAAFALCAAAAVADSGVAASRGTCPDGSPRHYFVVDGATATDCTTGGGTYDVECCCKNGSWAACSSSSGGGLASTDIDTSSELRTIVTDEVGTGALMFGLDTAMADGLSCSASQVVRRNAGDTAFECATPSSGGSVIFDIGDDGGNDSTAITEISTINDDYSAVTEPSADEAQINFAKIPPYREYDPNRPPSSCATCDEFTNGTSLTFRWQNQESSTATATNDGLLIAHPADYTGFSVYWFTGPDGSATDWAMHAKVSFSFEASYNNAGIVVLATGTEATPTLIDMWRVYYGGANILQPMTSSDYVFTTTVNRGAVPQTTSDAHYFRISYVSATKVLSYAHSTDGYAYRLYGTRTLGAHPTTSFGLFVSSLAANGAEAFFHYVRVRTDANRLNAGE